MKKWLRWCGMGVLLTMCAMAGFVVGLRFEKMDRVEDGSIETQSTQMDALQEFRLERQQLRQMQKSQLNDIIYGGNADEEIISLAQQKLLELMTWEEQEMTLENVLDLRQFEDVVVTVHTDSVNVMVRSDGLNQQETAVILELVMRETGISGGNVKIIPIN